MSGPGKEMVVQVTTPAQLISQGIEKGLDVEQLGKLMDLQERWEAKEAKKAFAVAMSQFQANKPDLLRQSGVSHDQGKTNKFFFAPLDKIQKAVDPILSQFGLSYSWKQSGEGDKIKITCLVSHIDGHSEETFLEGEHDSSGSKNKIQAIGSAVSYLKRYTLMNAFGLSTGDDDGASTQMNADEIDALMLEKLIKLKSEKKIEDKATADRLDQIIEKKESSSYKKAIKILEKL